MMIWIFFLCIEKVGQKIGMYEHIGREIKILSGLDTQSVLSISATNSLVSASSGIVRDFLYFFVPSCA